MKTRSLLIAALLTLGSFPAFSDDAQSNRFWQASLGENMQVCVSLNSVTSVAMHPYMLNGTTMVTEVTIDTTGNNSIRFYYVHADEKLGITTSPQNVLGTGKREINRAITNQEAGSQIPSVKFPEGVYAHTIEYQINSLEDLTKLHKSILNAWRKPGSSSFKLESK